MRRRQEGQALVEFAFALPMFAVLVMVTIQLGLIFVAYYNQTQMARETARWLAVHPDSTDDAVAQYVQTHMLPGMIGGTPSVISDDNVTAKYLVGKLTTTFTACGTTSPPPCTNADRAPTATVQVTMSYDVSGSILFLPSTFRIGPLVVGIPTSLPPYKVSVMVE